MTSGTVDRPSREHPVRAVEHQLLRPAPPHPGPDVEDVTHPRVQDGARAVRRRP